MRRFLLLLVPLAALLLVGCRGADTTLSDAFAEYSRVLRMVNIQPGQVGASDVTVNTTTEFWVDGEAQISSTEARFWVISDGENIRRGYFFEIDGVEHDLEVNWDEFQVMAEFGENWLNHAAIEDLRGMRFVTLVFDPLAYSELSNVDEVLTGDIYIVLTLDENRRPLSLVMEFEWAENPGIVTFSLNFNAFNDEVDRELGL